MWEFLKDIIYPKKCVLCKRISEFLCPDCFSRLSFYASFVCAVCLKNSMDGRTHPHCRKKYEIDGLISSYSYNFPVKKLLYQFKYKPYLLALKDYLGELMCESLIQQEIFNNVLKSKPIVIPIPLSSKKEKIRGYNHAALLAYHVAQYFKLKYNEKTLIRVKDTKPQFRLSKNERFSNLKNAFLVKHPNEIQGENIFIVDDIATTCSTLREATNILKRSGAKQVFGLTFAKEL